MNMERDNLFDVKDKCVVITGGAGVLCSEMAKALARRGAKICVIDFDGLRGDKLCREIETAGGVAVPVEADVLDRGAIESAFRLAVESLGKVDVLINGAGGNKKEATCSQETSFFDLPADALQWVFNLNCIGTMLPSQVFGRHMADRREGVIVNISSMCALQPLTNVVGYSAAKAAVSNFTQWLATYMARNFSPDIRVNAIAPGFFLTEQNRFLLVDDSTDRPTARGQQIIDHTPMGRYGEPKDLIGTLQWLISDAARFVTGIVVPIDGGFSAYSGV